MKIAEYNEMMAYMLRPAQKENIQTADLVEDLEPGSLKDELLKDFDPSQETYEEYLQRKSMRETAAYGGRMGFQEAGLAHGNRKTLTAKEKKFIDAYEEKTGLKYADQSGAQQWRIRNIPNRGKNQAIDASEFSKEVKARIKKYQKEYDEGDSAKRSSIRSGKYKGFDIKKIDDPVRLKAIENYIKDFKKEKGSLPTRNEVRKHFKATTGKDSNKALDFYLKKNNINLPTGYGTTSANLVDKDVKKLLNNKNIIKTLDQGKFPTENQIKNILKSDISVAEGRAIDLANTLKGNRDIRFFKAPTKYKKLANNYLETNIGDMFKSKGTKSRLYYERGLTKLLNLPKNIAKIRGDIIGKINNIVPDLKGKINVDEIGSLTASMRRGSGPYAIFGQVLGSDFNQHVKGLGIDKTKSLLEKKLTTDVLKNDPQRLIEQENYNQKVKEFEADANKNNPAKKVKGLKLSFEPPSETIKNKKIYNQYKDLFDAHYEKTGYSFEVPADRESIVDISKKLDNKSFQDTIKNRFKNLINRPGPRGGKIGLTTALATLAGTGFALADDMTPNEEGLSTAEKTGIGAGVAGGAYAARKPILKTLGKIARPVGRVLGAPSLAGGLALSELLSDDPNLGVAGADLLLPELAKQAGVRGILANPFQLAEKASKFGKIGRGIASLARAPSMFTPIGLGLMGIEGVRMGMREQDRINEMRMNEPDKYEEYLDELESYGDFSA